MLEAATTYGDRVQAAAASSSAWHIALFSGKEESLQAFAERLAQSAPPVRAVVGGVGTDPANGVVVEAALETWGPTLELLQIHYTGHEWVPWPRLPPACVVCNCFGMEVGIAEYVMLAMLEFCIGTAKQDTAMKDGKALPPWTARAPKAVELQGKALGLVGFGHIGLEISRRAVAFGMRVLAVSASGSSSLAAELPAGVTLRRAADGGLQEVLQEADFLVVACALNASTRGLIGAAELALMRGGALLVNVARGPVVEEAALYEALREKRLGGAVLDVWWRYPTASEPASDAFAWSSLPFHELENVRMTPHSSGWSQGFVERRVAQLAENLDRLAAGRPLLNRVARPK